MDKSKVARFFLAHPEYTVKFCNIITVVFLILSSGSVGIVPRGFVP